MKNAHAARVWGGGKGRGISGALALLATALTAGGAQAAVTVVSQRVGDPPSTIYADGDKVRVEGNRGQGGANPNAIIFDAASRKMVIIDDAAKTYVEFTDADMKKIRGQFSDMEAQMQERLKSLPPDKRKQMEEMMAKMGGASGGGMGMGGPPPKPAKAVWAFESLGQKKTINGFACQMFRVSKNGAPHEESCLLPWSAGLVKKSDFEGLRKFGEEMLAGLNPQGGGSAFDDSIGALDQYPGIPVSRVALHADGTRGVEEQIKSIKRDAIPASKFVPPAGYTKKDMAASIEGHRHGGPKTTP